MENSLFNLFNHSIDIEVIKRNVIGNMRLFRRIRDFSEVVDFFRGKVIVIIGAGPSLERNLDYIRELRKANDIIFMVVDKAYRGILEFGISPDVVVTAEPRDFFLKEFKNIDKVSYVLSYIGASSKRLEELFFLGANVIFYDLYYFDDRYNRLRMELGFDGLSLIGTGGTVFTNAVSMSILSMPKALIFVGNDLAFRRRVYFHSGHSIDDIKEKDELIEVLASNGELFYTTKAFFIAKLWIEELVARSGIIVYDASYPGVSGKNIVKVE